LLAAKGLLMPAAKPRTPRADAEPQFSRAQWLAEILRERIISGAYQPGERIREAQLREEFGFSNGPIREALQKVVAAGLAESAPWQGVRVRLLDQTQILELFQVRLALLEYAAELAARNASAETQRDAARDLGQDHAADAGLCERIPAHEPRRQDPGSHPRADRHHLRQRRRRRARGRPGTHPADGARSRDRRGNLGQRAPSQTNARIMQSRPPLA
jgi:DNA-binding FadR family transcriptional regulator